MTDKELKKLSRVELLEMLVEMSKENEALHNKLTEQDEHHQTEIADLKEQYQAQIDALQAKLDDKTVAIGNAGSIAEACLQINGIFEAAQASAEQYLINVRNTEDLCREMKNNADADVAIKMANADIEAQRYLDDAKTQAARMISDAEEKTAKMIADAQTKTASYWDSVSKRLANFYKERQGPKDLFGFPDEAQSDR